MMDNATNRCVLIAAGGTGGHVIPAIEVAKVLRGRGWECIFVGTKRGFENHLVPKAGFLLQHVSIGSFNRVSLRQKMQTALSVPLALAALLSMVSRYRPGVALSLGGYASGPLVLACALSDVPIVLLEPNAYPGLANRLAAVAARFALLGHPQATTFFRTGLYAVIGLPVRKEFFLTERQPPRKPLGVLILGGSQGASSLNEAAIGAARTWTQNPHMAPLMLHQTGKLDYQAVSDAYQKLGFQAVVAPFFEDMPERFAQADLVICRAGASVIAELCAARKPAVLVPFPHAADDHQNANGQVLKQAGGALLVADCEWTSERMVQEIDNFSTNPSKLEAMAVAMEPLSSTGAAETAADVLVSAANRGGFYSHAV